MLKKSKKLRLTNLDSFKSENSDISVPIADGSRSMLFKKGGNNVLSQLNDNGVVAKRNLPIFSKFHRRVPVMPSQNTKDFQEDLDNSLHYSSLKNNEDPYGEGLRKISKREKIVTIEFLITQCDSDSEDDASDNENEIGWWILLPDNDYKRIWDVIIFM
jgi:hypothetical protein